MDLCADMLLAHLPSAAPGISAADVGPPFRRRLSCLTGRARNVDRLLNRFRYYPRHARRIAPDFDLFHVVDHSYSQILHGLPSGRAGVYCHDLDTFRCLLDPVGEPRPRWFRAMAHHILRGFQKAAVVFYTTAAVRQQIEQFGLVDPGRLVHAPNGAAPEFTPEPMGYGPEELASRGGWPFLLHVGSTIARKRIDVLLDVVAAVRRRRPDVRLVQVGGTWTEEQQAQIDRLFLGEHVRQVRGIGRPELAVLYRQAALVLVPSEAEGFGLPVVEALACGAVVVASDIPPLREVGGPAVVYCPVGDVLAWSETVSKLLDSSDPPPERAIRLAWSAKFSWAAQSRTIADTYLRLIGQGSLTCESSS